MTYDSVVLADSPLAYWKLDEASGSSVAVDSSGYGFNLSMNGTVTFGALSPFGIDSGAVQGTAPANSLQHATADLVTALSFDALLTIDTVPGATETLASYNYASTNIPLAVGWDLDGAHAGQFGVAYYETSSYAWHAVHLPVGAMVAGQDYYVGGGTDGADNLFIYLNDGTINATAAGASYSQAGTADPFFLLRDWAAVDGFTGKVNNFALYPTLLTSTRFAAHFAALPPRIWHGALDLVQNQSFLLDSADSSGLVLLQDQVIGIAGVLPAPALDNSVFSDPADAYATSRAFCDLKVGGILWVA